MDIVRLRPEQVPEAAAVLARAFQDDPAWSWIVPGAARRAKALPPLFRLGFELIEAAERDGVPCALLTNSEQNLAFYEAHGFLTMLEGETPRGGPHAWMMVRQR